MSWFRFGSALVQLVVALLYMVQFGFTNGSAVVKLVLSCGSALVQCWFNDGAVCVQVGFSVGSLLCGSLVHGSVCFRVWSLFVSPSKICGVVQQGFSGDLVCCVWSG